MSKPAFTPGPWFVFSVHADGRPWSIYSNRPEDNKIPGRVGQRILRSEAFMSPTSEEAMANARLISASPDMYEALQLMTSAFRPFSSRPVGAPNSEARAEQDAQIVAHKLARDAIAKAEGRS